MRRAVIAVAAAALAVSSRAGAAGDAQSRVAVDWSRVTDADVARSGLSRLRAGTIERLVDSGFAVVGARAPGVLGVAVVSVDSGLRIRVDGGTAVRDETLEFAEPCDQT